MAPAVNARRRVVQLLGDKQAARIVFEKIAPRFVDRPGGYTRIFKLATPRLGDAGPRAILEFVGPACRRRPQKPAGRGRRPVEGPERLPRAPFAGPRLSAFPDRMGPDSGWLRGAS